MFDGKYRAVIKDAKTGLVVHDPRLRVAIIKAVDASQEIPENEPTILFRARDNRAVAGALAPYLAACIEDECTEEHLLGICDRINAFIKFGKENRDKMKQPGITRGL